MKKWLIILGGLLAFVFLTAEVNQGIQTRGMYGDFAIASGKTDTTHVIFKLGGYAEQGLAAMVIQTNYTDTLNIWFSSGTALSYFAVDTGWSDMVKACTTQVFTAGKTCQPVNMTFLQSKALVDFTSRSTGYIPAQQFLRVSVEPYLAGAGAALSGRIWLAFK